MKPFGITEDSFVYLANTTFLLVSYFTFRILPLPIVLLLYASQCNVLLGGSVYQITKSILHAYSLIPIQCKLGSLAFYSMQLWWFRNIFSKWITLTTKYFSRLLYKCIVPYTNRNLTKDKTYPEENKYHNQ